MLLPIPPVGDPAHTTPEARYRAVQDAAKALLDPLLALMPPGRAEVMIADPRPTVQGPIGNRLCTRFEACVRPLLLAAHWLHSLEHAPRPEHETTRRQVSEWFRAALLLGTDPLGSQYWGADANYYQLHVDMGLLPIAFQMARRDLWEPFSPEEKARIAAWLGTSRGAAYVHANHYFMGVHIMEFLAAEGFGHRMDRPLIDNFFRRMEAWYHGGGWFEDGANQSFDYYNAYAFHYYGLWWTRLYGDRDPARARRWRGWTRLFLGDYEHFFAATGENAPFGRSLPYRFNAIAIFGLAVLEDACDLPLGRVRRLCMRNLDFFLQRPIFQEQGCISYGWTDRFDPIAESYSHPGSPYWAAKGLSALLVPPGHTYWREAETPLLSERGDYARVMTPAGLVVRSTGGAVEILNAGTQISDSRVFMGVWKWSKTAYRTGVGYTVPAKSETDWSIDSALTQTVTDGRVFGRHATYALALGAEHSHCAWNMGDRDGPLSTGVETVVFWKAGWLLQLHHCAAHQPSRLKLGGFALSSVTRGGLALTAPPRSRAPLCVDRGWTRHRAPTPARPSAFRLGPAPRRDDSAHASARRLSRHALRRIGLGRRPAHRGRTYLGGSPAGRIRSLGNRVRHRRALGAHSSAVGPVGASPRRLARTVETTAEATPPLNSTPPFVSTPSIAHPPMKAGTLSYTPATLRSLFCWLLAGDVLFMLCEQIESKILPVILKSHQATDIQIALIVTSIQSIVTCIAAPIVSYRSDRKRSRWGRRIPYIFWATPLFTLAMAATPFAPEFAHWLARVPVLRDCLGWFHASPVIVAFAVLAVIYRFLQIIVVSMFFALFRDVVPMSHMGRFLGLFRIFGSLATFVVTFWLIGLADTHSRTIFVVVALVNFAGFSLICLKVKEGEYPPNAPPAASPATLSWWTRVKGPVLTFIKEAYSDPLIFWTFCTRGMAFAATGISSFIIFFPQRELGIPLDRAGVILSAPIFIWIFAAYPIGRLMDRVGATPILSFALLVSSIAYTVSFFVVSGPITFAVSSIIGGVAFWAILLSQLQLAQEIFPVARYGQLSSANQLQTSLVLAVMITPLVGWSLDALRGLHLVLPVPLLGDLAVGPYRSVNLMLALVFILSWLCLQHVKRLRAKRGDPVPI